MGQLFFSSKYSNFLLVSNYFLLPSFQCQRKETSLIPSKARRTLELSAELSVTRGCWRKLFPQVCGVMFCDFCHACHELRIFNMLNNFVHEWTLTHSVRAFWAISSGINANAHASLPCFIEVKMAANNSIVADAVLEDKLADLWPDYPCLYDVRCPEFKNRELRDKAFQELAEKLGTTCKIIQNFISVKNTNIWGRFDRTAIQLFILGEWVKAKISALRNSFSKVS